MNISKNVLIENENLENRKFYFLQILWINYYINITKTFATHDSLHILMIILKCS